MQTNRGILRIFLILFIFHFAFSARAQLMNHYWSQSYNSISSLLSGAVVAGDAGPSSIYYNPATISELTNGTNISVAASFLTLNYYSYTNAIGDGLGLSTTNFYVQPQFFSMSFNSPDRKLSVGVATFTRIRERLSFNYGNSIYGTFTNVTNGRQRLTTTYKYRNDYDDSWLGIGGAYSFANNFSVGVSLLFSASTLTYHHELTALLNSANDTVGGLPEGRPYLVAENDDIEEVLFTNIRFVSKIGISYKPGRWSFGLNITTPGLNIFTTGRLAERRQKELYGSDGSLEPLTNYLIYDVQEGSDIKANYKLPFSVAFGLIYDFESRVQRFYATIEYFAGLKPYKMIEAPVNEEITSKPVFDELENKDWLSFAYGATPVLNLALGYQWFIKKDLLLMMGIRTDFNNIDNLDLGELSSYNTIKTGKYDIYHATGGVQFNFKKHLLVAGTQLSFGYKLNQKQIANFDDLSEINLDDQLPLFGEPKNIMDTYYFSISLFLGATLNFQKKDKTPKE